MSRPAIAEALGLEPHPEGGWFRETYRSRVRFEPPGFGAERSAATAIYYLLGPGDQSRWHTVRSDELWLWHRGGPLELLLGGGGERPEAAPARIVLGLDTAAGQAPQALVPAGTWQSARPAGGEEVLVTCVVAPGFEFADFRLL
jgi:predicted cupin superfamily sugar epimerase